MSDWSEIWEIRFNAKKCKSLHMGKSNPKTVYYMKEGDQKIPLEQVSEEKDLGVTFCDTLKFDKHILNCVNKANKILGIVKRSFTYMNRDMFIQLYKSLIRPNLEYATVIWNPYLKKNIFLIENVQRRATKLAWRTHVLLFWTPRYLSLCLRQKVSRVQMVQITK